MSSPVSRPGRFSRRRADRDRCELLKQGATIRKNARELSELDLGDDIEALNLISDAAKCADAASGILQATDQLAEQLSELYHSLSRETRPGIEPITGAFEGYFEKVDELNAATSEHEYELWRCGHARPDVDIDEMVANARDVIERARASRRSSPGERMTDSGS